MAFNNWGAWVFVNGIRRKDRECVSVFSDEWMPDTTWQRVWYHTQQNYVDDSDDFIAMPDEIEFEEFDIEQEPHFTKSIYHAVLGDANIRVGIYKDWADLYIKDGESIKTIELIKESFEQFDGCIFSNWGKIIPGGTYKN